MRKYLTLALVPAGLAIASLAFAAPGTSTTAQSAPAVHSKPMPPTQQITDEQLLKFDRAVLGVRNVRKQYEPKLKAATTDAEKTQIQHQEKQAAGKAITQYMPVSQFRQIAHQVRHDPALKARAKKVAGKAQYHHSHHTVSPNTGTK